MDKQLWKCQRCNGTGLKLTGCINDVMCLACSGSGKSAPTQEPLVIADDGQAAQKREADRELARGYRAAAEALRVERESDWKFNYGHAPEHLERLAKELEQ